MLAWCCGLYPHQRMLDVVFPQHGKEGAVGAWHSSVGTKNCGLTKLPLARSRVRVDDRHSCRASDSLGGGVEMASASMYLRAGHTDIRG